MFGRGMKEGEGVVEGGGKGNAAPCPRLTRRRRRARQMKAWVVEGRRRRRKRRKRRRKRKEGRHIFLGQKAVWRGRVVVSLGVARGERRLRSKWKWKGEEEEEGLSCSYYNITPLALLLPPS
jgi:hypothetical protein